MPDNFLEQLLAAKSAEEETKILLKMLPVDISRAAWAVAIPHWFNAEIIAILLPDMAAQAEDLYVQLQRQSFVEPFQDRGHNIHELTRKRILNLWWHERRPEYRRISESAHSFFSSKEGDIHAIEAAYHYLVSMTFDPEDTISRWNRIASQLKTSRQYALVHTLIQNTREHISGGRVPANMEGLVSQWERSFAKELVSIGKQHQKKEDWTSATEILDHAQKLYADLHDEKAQANILIKLGGSYFQKELSDRIFRELEQHKAAIADLNRTTVDSYRSQANLLRFSPSGRMREALSLRMGIIEIDPEDFDSHLAIVSMTKELDGNVPSIYMDKARQYVREGDWYALTCLESVCENFDLAFEHLKRAAQDENFDPAWAWKDPDLQWIRDTPHFLEIVGPKPEE